MSRLRALGGALGPRAERIFRLTLFGLAMFYVGFVAGGNHDDSHWDSQRASEAQP